MRLLVASIIAVPSLALAQPSVVAPAAPESGPVDGLELQARMPTGLGLDTVISPGVMIGHRADGFVIGGQIGLVGGKFSTDNGGGGTNSTSVLLLTVMPMITYDLWTSPDGRARLNFVGGVGYGRGSEATDSNDGAGNTSHSEATVTFLPILAGIGGDYFLSPNFALGVEMSAEVPVLLSVQDNGMDQHVSGNLESVHGLLRATFIVGP